MVDLERSICKYSKLYTRNIINSTDLVHLFVHNVIFADRQGDVASLLALLPPEVAEDVLVFIRTTRQNGYRWHPSVVGPGFTDAGLAKISSGLREMDQILLLGERQGADPERHETKP
ncbi:MAG TPA: hypothetical protein VF278_12515 [Pirellulales bacterium]